MAAQIQCAFSVYNVITVIQGLIFVSYEAQRTLGNMLLGDYFDLVINLLQE